MPDQNAASDQTVFSNQSPAADKTVISNQSPAPDRTVASDPDRATDRTLVSDQTTTTALSSASKPRRRAASEDSSESRLPVGTVLAQRYEVKSVLGTGGMGAVYKVFDRRLSRLVALKTIHPQLASTPEIMRRFTQEVLLAQKVVHKNVVRIFDIGDDGPTHFITMDLIEGVSLKDLILERGKFAPEEAIAVIREVCHALAAAHAEGIVHRDLKPQNIMIDSNQHVVVMDFGIARSNESAGATQTGALLGTPHYMSPEQARMEPVDSRSDIFSLGLILYELLTGKLPFECETVVETMFARIKERAIPPVEIERGVPTGANEIVVKCLEPDRDERYQAVEEILEDLDRVDPSKKAGVGTVVKARLKRASRYRNVAAAAALAVLVLLVVGFMVQTWYTPVEVAVPDNATVLIADFDNQTGDSVFDGTLEPIVRMELEQASFITAFERRQVRSLGLDPISGRLDETLARQIAVGQGLGYVISGSLERSGAGYAVSVEATEAVTGEVVLSREATAPGDDNVLLAAVNLATAVREALGDDTSDSARRFAGETLAATSLEAVSEYSAAMEAQSNGQMAQALERFSAATRLDPTFGLAYAGMAVASYNLVRPQDAQEYIDLALERIGPMTERERYRTRAFAYVVSGNREKCVDEYTALIDRFPSDVAAHNNLANCLTQLRMMPEAIREVTSATEILPQRALYRNNLALFLGYNGDFAEAEREARTAQEMQPDYDKSYVAMAFAQLGQGNTEGARATYERLAEISPYRAESGLADLALYEGRFAEAGRAFEAAAAEDLAAGDADRAAERLVGLAYVRLSQDRVPEAVAAAEQALTHSGTDKIQFLAGRILATAGEEARARELADSLASALWREPRAHAKLIEGEIALQGGDAGTAVTLFAEGNALLDTWIGRFDLGRAYLALGAYTEADGEFERCLRRSGEALSLFVDESPTWGYFPLVYYYMGRAREEIGSSDFADFYNEYLSIRGGAGEDPLLGEARSRIG